MARTSKPVGPACTYMCDGGEGGIWGCAVSDCSVAVLVGVSGGGSDVSGIGGVVDEAVSGDVGV